ncbi:NUDIX domain-containing protein [Kutzneria sp. 744]|uniref:NUDIX domain-containing protein n=1 Tax=Kutzneria sp. (strain 744) TaxID=345341 RepID=UPI0003EEA558|nr:NUDIX domain-containing protein [Kutzneria sp. 744]EWM17604.1 MutT/NUDIX family protein [Kutzneria sp. 744]
MRSAGILVFRKVDGRTEVLIGHMGGPFWARKDDGAWSVPKGLIEDGEDPLAAARREFREELGLPAPDGELLPLGDVKQSGKTVTLWAVEGDLDPDAVVPGTFDLEWPPRSGKTRQFPEVDRVAWFTVDDARVKLVKGQRAFLDRLPA